jgi:hypothetical protein
MKSHSFSKAVICFLIFLFAIVLLGFAQDATPTIVAGGSGGNAFSDNEFRSGGRILEIRVFAGQWIDGIQIVYELADGQIVTGSRHGGSGGRQNSFRLDPDEYITGISGRYGERVDSFQIRTNRRTSPMFGGSGGNRDYLIEVPYGEQGVGFTGRSGIYLDAIGLLSMRVNLRQTTESTIYGGRGGSAFSDKDIPQGARISEIRIQAGNGIDGIQAIYTLRDGRTQEGPYHGGRGGRRNVFRLDSDEYVIALSGRYGINVDSIAIQTNKRTSPVYGGGGGDRDFKIEVPSGFMGTAFCGRSGEMIDAIGLVYERIDSTWRNQTRRAPGRNRF